MKMYQPVLSNFNANTVLFQELFKLFKNEISFKNKILFKNV